MNHDDVRGLQIQLSAALKERDDALQYANKEHETARGWSQKAAELQDALAVRNEPPNEFDLVSRIGALTDSLAAAQLESKLLRDALERIFGHGYHENQHPAGQDYVSKVAIAQARAALAGGGDRG